MASNIKPNNPNEKNKNDQIVCHCDCGGQEKKTSELFFEWFTITLTALSIGLSAATLYKTVKTEYLLVKKEK